MRFVVMFAGAVLALPAAVILYFTRRTASDSRQAVFAAGGIPDPLPHGLYRGSVPGYEGLAAAWYGKRFEAAACAGVNLLRANDQLRETAPFRTYQDRSLHDSGREVLRVDYNLTENPFWLRICADELVQLEPGHLLGKAFVRLIPGHPFAMLFFELQAEDSVAESELSGPSPAGHDSTE